MLVCLSTVGILIRLLFFVLVLSSVIRGFNGRIISWLRLSSFVKILVVNYEVVHLRRVGGQTVVLLEESEQFGRRAIICECVSWQSFVLEHELEECLSNALPLERLVHVEVKNAPRFDLSQCTRVDVERLVSGLQQCEGCVLLHNHVQVLVSRRLD